MLRSQELETPLGIRELNEPDLAWLLQTSPEPVEPDLALHQGSGTFSQTLCWTWPGSAPKPPRPSPEPSPLNLTWLCTKASQTFSGTFSGTCTSAHRSLAYAVGEKGPKMTNVFAHELSRCCHTPSNTLKHHFFHFFPKCSCDALHICQPPQTTDVSDPRKGRLPEMSCCPGIIILGVCKNPEPFQMVFPHVIVLFPLIVFQSAGFTPWPKDSHERGKGEGKGRVKEGKRKNRKGRGNFADDRNKVPRNSCQPWYMLDINPE